MDVTCATCQEPWEHHHMLYDAAWETWDGEEGSSSYLLIEKFLASPRTSIPKMLRDDFTNDGWEFGRTVVCILKCPCCSAAGEATGDVDLRKRLRLELEELLGDDLDGIISQMTSVDMFAELG